MTIDSKPRNAHQGISLFHAGVLFRHHVVHEGILLERDACGKEKKIKACDSKIHLMGIEGDVVSCLYEIVLAKAFSNDNQEKEGLKYMTLGYDRKTIKLK